MVFGLFFQKRLTLQIQNSDANFPLFVLSICWVIRFAIGFLFQATVQILRRKPTTYVICCWITINAWAESLNPGGKFPVGHSECGGQGRDRTADAGLFRAALYH